MKKRVSATIDPETDKILDRLIEVGNYRNKSHIIEDAILLLSKEKNVKNKK
ncbi:ribbon-helix-helix protein, CopG family [Candidatus Pacearchaeota archaeon]|nr:ribbon-helix-helix protein, CopG family [Candidatus Pacearchaeota archaeon]